MFFSGFHHQIMSGSLLDLNSQNLEVWPMFLFLNVISALEGTLYDLISSNALVIVMEHITGFDPCPS